MMSDARDEAYPSWWPSALKKPVADLAALWREDDFLAWVEEGYVDRCVRCKARIGVPQFHGRCWTCYSRVCKMEMRRHMPRDSDPFNPRDLDPLWQRVINRPNWEHILRTEEHREFVSRDASFWGLRSVERFQAYRVQIWLLAATGAHPAYPWRLDMRDITSDHERLRFRTDMGELYESGTDAQPAIARVRLWQIGRRAWIEGVWDRVMRDVRWSIENMQSLNEREKPIWEATKRALSRQGAFRGGRPRGYPESREELIQAVRDAWERARANDVRIELLPRKEWRAVIGQYMRLGPTWTDDGGMPDSTLRDHLNGYKLKLRDILPELYGQ